MATTIQSAFLEFKSNLEITVPQKRDVSNGVRLVFDAVSKELTVLDSFLTCSYSRRTMIAPLREADIDIFVILDADYFHHYNGKNGGQAGLLDLLKRTLKKTYTKTPDISRNGQAVTITFTDFIVDVVPAFNRQGGGFLIPNSVGQIWIGTDPKKHVEVWTASNKWHNGDFAPLVKMLKRWNRMINSFFRSFHLETMALQLLNNVTISDFPSGVRFFFDKGRDYVTKQNPDPAGYKGDVGAYLNTKDKVNNAVSRFQTAYNRAFRAEDYANQNQIGNAINEWRKIFGNFFPYYG